MRLPIRRAVLVAVLPAAVAAFALPAVAQAATVGVSSDGRLAFVDDALSENNDVLLRLERNEIVISDRAVPIRNISGACRLVNPNRVECPANLDVNVNTFGGNDTVEYRLPQQGAVQLGADQDTLIAGTREGASFAIRRVTYAGGPGFDTITYGAADRGVRLTPEDGVANDGRPGIDQESVSPDFEVLEGSHFADTPLFGTPGADVMYGGGGNDLLGGGHGEDAFYSATRDGADDYHGGPGTDSMVYIGRTKQLLVDLDSVADDGELGENDNVRSNVENVFGGSAGDVIKSLGAHSLLNGFGGADTLIGGFGRDTLIGGDEVDHLEGGSENDVIDSRDGEVESIDCGTGVDTLRRDFDGFRSCENVQVGVLRLAPKAIRAEVGRTARLRLSWRHPRAWRRLRTIELRLTRDGVPVGEVAIRPRAQRIAAEGAVELVRRRSRLTHEGKTVIARLAVRLDDSLAGQTLKAEVEATDARGRRQLERNAGTIRVAP
jgi:RTX calcium-binding nonapeptide repeat (4 copies)